MFRIFRSYDLKKFNKLKLKFISFSFAIGFRNLNVKINKNKKKFIMEDKKDVEDIE